MRYYPNTGNLIKVAAFANLYKVVDGKLTFVICAKLGENSKVILPDVSDNGEYVAMICEFSDRLGDMDNDVAEHC